MFDFIDKTAEKVIETTFLGLIDGFTVNDMRDAVRRKISLLDETARWQSGKLLMAENMAKRFNGQSHHLTYENVVKWLSKKRSDLHSHIIFNYESQRWLKQQIEEFRAYLFEI